MLFCCVKNWTITPSTKGKGFNSKISFFTGVCLFLLSSALILKYLPSRIITVYQKWSSYKLLFRRGSDRGKQQFKRDQRLNSEFHEATLPSFSITKIVSSFHFHLKTNFPIKLTQSSSQFWSIIPCLTGDGGAGKSTKGNYKMSARHLEKVPEAKYSRFFEILILFGFLNPSYCCPVNSLHKEEVEGKQKKSCLELCLTADLGPICCLYLYHCLISVHRGMKWDRKKFKWK